MATKKKKKEEEERPDEMVLPDLDVFRFPISGKEVEIKPWSWGMYTKHIAPHIEEIFRVVEESNIDISAFRLMRLYLNLAPTKEEKEEYDSMLGPANKAMMQLMVKAGAQVAKIAELSTNMTEGEIEELHPTDVFHLCLHLYFLNPTVLGNAFMPFVEFEVEGQ